jgi:hypothetical protein
VTDPSAPLIPFDVFFPLFGMGMGKEKEEEKKEEEEKERNSP